MATFVEQLIAKGRRSTVNNDIVCTATQRSMRSHVALMEKNNVDLKNIMNSDVNAILDSLVDKKGKPVKDSYKLQIIATLKRMFGAMLPVNTKMYTIRARQKRAPSTQFMSNADKYIKFAARALTQAHTVENITLFDTCLTIMLIAATNLRIEEVHAFTIQHFITIRKHKSVRIKSKGSTVEGSKRSILYTRLLGACYNIILRTRKRYEEIVGNITHVNNRYRDYRPNRLSHGYVTVSSITQMRRQLVDMSGIVEPGSVITTNGFTAFRKFTTTLLVSNGEFGLAQFMNGHSKSHTTANYYDLSAQIDVNRAQDSVLQPTGSSGASTRPATETSTVRVSRNKQSRPTIAEERDDDDNVTDYTNREPSAILQVQDEQGYYHPMTPMTPSVEQIKDTFEPL